MKIKSEYTNSVSLIFKDKYKLLIEFEFPTISISKGKYYINLSNIISYDNGFKHFRFNILGFGIYCFYKIED